MLLSLLLPIRSPVLRSEAPLLDPSEWEFVAEIWSPAELAQRAEESLRPFTLPESAAPPARPRPAA